MSFSLIKCSILIRQKGNMAMTTIPTGNQAVATPATATSQAVVVSGINLFNILCQLKGANFITLVAETEPKMRKTGNPYANDIIKTAKINGQINFHYDKAVLNRLAKEGKDESSFRQGESWHQPVIRPDGTLTPFCQHKTKGSYYLRFRLLGRIDATFATKDGRPVNETEIDAFLQKSDYSNQGCDDPIIFLTYGLDSIKQMTINGVTYMVK